MTWTPERRARQAELIRATRPWEHATGPTSDAGKATSARNAYKGGRRARQRRAMAALRLIEALWRADRTCVTAVQRMVSERWIIAALLGADDPNAPSVQAALATAPTFPGRGKTDAGRPAVKT